MRLRFFIYGRMAFAVLAVLFFLSTVYTLNLKLLLLPSLLAAYYLAIWFLAGQDPGPGVIVPQYAPPADMSPAEMRYLLTSTSDRKTVAAVLAHLAAHKVISIRPEGDGYRITLLVNEPPASLPPEEASAFDALAQLQSLAGPEGASAASPARTFLFRPSHGRNLSLVASIVAGSLIRRTGSLYFKRNLRYSLPAVAVSVGAALVTSAIVGKHGEAIFLTLWFLLFSLGLGLIIATNVVRALRDAFSGLLSAKNFARTVVPLPIFLAIPGFVAVQIARASTPTFAWVLLSLVAVNIVGGIAIQTVTPLGRERMDQIEGFKQFLATVELDRLNRMNDPHLTPALLNDYMAYAIALDLKETWGDHLANALFMTTTSAG
jgi:Predicted membrane protein (DUF2207) C-terminal domain